MLVCFAVGMVSFVLPLYRDSSFSIAERVADLLSKMTLEEKVNQTLNDYSNGAFGPGLPSDLEGQKAIASEGMRYLFKFCEGQNLEECVKVRNHYQTVAMTKTRLGIPLTFAEETLHGSIYGPQYPMPVNLASTWNDSLVTDVFKQVASQASKAGVNVGLSPVINMYNDPRFGRLEEGFSEDPYLTSRMGVAAVLGLQGPVYDPTAYLVQPSRNDTASSSRLSAVVKHYLAYGHAEQGGIDGGPATLDEQTLRERYLPPWRALTERGMLRGVMASQSAVNHIPMHCHKRLITDVLRSELNASDVFVHSDGGNVISCIKGVYHMASTEGQAASLALQAGVDMDFGGSAYSQLGPEITSGRVPVAALDRAVTNILRVKFATGLFDKPANLTIPHTPELVTPAMVKTARDAAEQSITLLVNRLINSSTSSSTDDAGASAGAAPALPLSFGSIKSMLLAGPLIDDINSQQGGYSHESPDKHPTVTIKAAAEATAQEHGFKLLTTLGTCPGVPNGGGGTGCSGVEPVVANDAATINAAVEVAAIVDVAVLVLGDSLKTCGEMKDRAGLELLGGQPELLRRVAAVAKKTIIVLIGGRPLTFGGGLCAAPPTKCPSGALQKCMGRCASNATPAYRACIDSCAANCPSPGLTSASTSASFTGSAPVEEAAAAEVEAAAVAAGVGARFPWDPSQKVGASCSIPSLLQNISALFMAWRPGAQGGPALLDLIGGGANPSAHLPVAWPRSVGGIGAQSPYLQQFALHYRESYAEQPTTPLFRFGHGLSYSNFTLSTPTAMAITFATTTAAAAAAAVGIESSLASPCVVKSNGSVRVRVEVTNHAAMAGAATVQLYYQQQMAPVIRYYQQLAGYKKVHVGAAGSPHATVSVTIELRVRDLAFWDNKEAGTLTGKPGWSLGLDPGSVIYTGKTNFTLMVGLSAAACSGSYNAHAKSGGCDAQQNGHSVDITVVD